jgi:hypothetical protein
MMVKGITKDKVSMGLMLNRMAIYTRNIGSESLGLELNDNVSIPYVIINYNKERLNKKGIPCHSLCLSRGKVTYQLGKNQRFL